MKLLSTCFAIWLINFTMYGQSHLQHALDLIGLQFEQSEQDSMSEGVLDTKEAMAEMREFSLDNGVPPALYFNPLPMGFSPQPATSEIDWQVADDINVPADLNDLAFYSILELAALVKTRKITSTELTRFFLERLQRFGDTLECVISITEERALKMAALADAEIAAGNYRGVLHGIPYGAKDLLAVQGYKTTWGAMPYKDQVLEETATVVQNLDAAGAILVAKLTLGALAWGDVWYGGVTRNPWNLAQGSSGSSAGSASATVAGLVPFAIGTETLGSIVSPSTRCRASGLRPTFGRVSRSGAMALSWSMDKIGPICRSAEDCAIVFAAIQGVDGKDYTLMDAAFDYDQNDDAKSLRVGYFENLFNPLSPSYPKDSAALQALKDGGIILEPINYNIDLPVGPLRLILSVEAAAAFDELTRSNQDSLLVRQIKNAWPNVFREARLIPAVEYLQANRFRTMLIEKFHAMIKDYDVIVTPSFSGSQLLVTNLTGQPCMVVPHGFAENGSGTSISFIGNLFDEHKIITLAKYFQKLTEHEDRHPLGF